MSGLVSQADHNTWKIGLRDKTKKIVTRGICEDD